MNALTLEEKLTRKNKPYISSQCHLQFLCFDLLHEITTWPYASDSNRFSASCVQLSPWTRVSFHFFFSLFLSRNVVVPFSLLFFCLFVFVSFCFFMASIGLSIKKSGREKWRGSSPPSFIKHQHGSQAYCCAKRAIYACHTFIVKLCISKLFSHAECGNNRPETTKLRKFVCTVIRCSKN